MNKEGWKWFLAWLLTFLAGSGLHFLFDLVPNGLTALISPVNESPWEHLKLLFWPYLAVAWVLVRGEPEPWRAWAGHLAALLIMPAVLLGAFYAMTAGFALEQLWVDILLYALVLAGGFALAHHVGCSPEAEKAAPVLLLAVCLLAVLLTLFTFAAPALPVFEDPVPACTLC